MGPREAAGQRREVAGRRRQAAGQRRQAGKIISTLFLLKATSQIQGQLPDIECYKVNNFND